MKILMSRDNPEGRKLNEILQDLIDDIKIKSSFIEGKHAGYERSVEHVVVQNNEKIIGLLKGCISYDNISHNMLDTIGKNKGPKEPRL